MRLALFILILVGCAPITTVDHEIAPYVPIGTRLEKTLIQFGWVPDTMRDDGQALPSTAACFKYPMQNIIQIHREAWTRLSPAQRTWVLRHEIGHCEQNLEHDNSVDAQGCPLSVMFWHVPDRMCLDRFKLEGVQNEKVYD